MLINEHMSAALEESRKAYAIGEIPVGCVITHKNQIIAKAHNLRETGKNAIFHAEINAISQACAQLDRWRLDGCDIYVTLEPCMMCAGAIINARIERLFFGAFDEKYGGVCHIQNDSRLKIYGGINEEECVKVLNEFFKELRRKS